MSDPERVKSTAAAYRQQAQELEATAKFLDEFENVINAKPELMPVLLERLSPKGVVQTKDRTVTTAVRAKGKSAGRLLDWFESTGNQPATIGEMATAISLGHAAIRQTVYMTYADMFEKVGKKDGTRETLFVRKKGAHL